MVWFGLVGWVGLGLDELAVWWFRGFAILHSKGKVLKNLKSY